MIYESGRVVAIESDSLWVETIQQSTCGSCAAQKGCGQSLLAKIGIKTSYLRVLLDQRKPSDFAIDDEVQIGIPDDIIVKSSLFAYIVPIILLVVFASVAQQFFTNELYVVASGFLGLLLGGVFIQIFSRLHRHDSRYQPVLIDRLISNDLKKDAELNHQAQVINMNND